MSTLEKALALAAQAHAGQVDKAGAPYILHPIRVMLHMETVEERITAVLHDLIEDTDWTLDLLRREGFGGEVLAALDCLTRREGEDYDGFIERLCRDPLAVQVKIADLEDNLDRSRLPRAGAADELRMEKYRRALLRLKRQLQKNDA